MTGQALLVIDMQQGLFKPDDVAVVDLIGRLNALAARVRTRQVPVIFIQHCGRDGDTLHPAGSGHALHPALNVLPDDRTIAKESCDAFLDTELPATLAHLGVDELIITGAATDFCVDTTVRAALARGFRVIVPADGHTAVSDRPHLPAAKVVEHHNFIWANLVSPIGSATVATCSRIV